MRSNIGISSPCFPACCKARDRWGFLFGTLIMWWASPWSDLHGFKFWMVSRTCTTSSGKTCCPRQSPAQSRARLCNLSLSWFMVRASHAHGLVPYHRWCVLMGPSCVRETVHQSVPIQGARPMLASFMSPELYTFEQRVMHAGIFWGRHECAHESEHWKLVSEPQPPPCRFHSCEGPSEERRGTWCPSPIPPPNLGLGDAFRGWDGITAKRKDREMVGILESLKLGMVWLANQISISSSLAAGSSEPWMFKYNLFFGASPIMGKSKLMLLQTYVMRTSVTGIFNLRHLKAIFRCRILILQAPFFLNSLFYGLIGYLMH